MNGYKPVTPIQGSRTSQGLTKREHFAGMLMQGFISGEPEGADTKNADWYANAAVGMAEALLKALDK